MSSTLLPAKSGSPSASRRGLGGDPGVTTPCPRSMAWYQGMEATRSTSSWRDRPPGRPGVADGGWLATTAGGYQPPQLLDPPSQALTLASAAVHTRRASGRGGGRLGAWQARAATRGKEGP